MLWELRARAGYFIARKLMASRQAVRQPKLWRWMEGQFARMAALGDVKAQSFYGHILTFPVKQGRIINVVAFLSDRSSAAASRSGGRLRWERPRRSPDHQRPTTFGLYAQKPGRGPTLGWLRQVSGRLS